MASTQVVSAAIQIIAALVFCFVGFGLATRFPTSPRGRPAILGFAGYWVLLGFAAFLSALIHAMAAAGWTVQGPTAWTLYLVSRALVLAGISGFMFYLAYVYDGRPRVALSILALYLAFGIGQLYLLVDGRLEAQPDAFSVPFYASGDAAWLPPQIAFLIALLPFVAGTVGLIFLGVRTRRRTTRYRAFVVGGGLLFWALAAGTDSSLRIAGVAALAPEIVALVAALAVYFAYFPPVTVARWIERKDEERRARLALSEETDA